MTLNGWQRLFVAYLFFLHLPATGLIAYSEFADAKWYGYGPVEPEVLKRLPNETVSMLESGRLSNSGINGCTDGAIQITGVDALPRLPSDVCFRPIQDTQESPGLSLGEQKARAIADAEQRLAGKRGDPWENDPVVSWRDSPIVESRARDMPELAPALRSISDAYRSQGLREAAAVCGWGLFLAVVLAAFGWTVGWVVRGFVGDATPNPRALSRGSGWAITRLLRRLFFR